MGDLYVDDNASGGDGSRAKPYPTIRQAVSKATAGQTIVVAAGTYRETVAVTKPLRLLGEPGATIKGSDVWTGWTKEGAYWTKPYSLSFVQHGLCRDGSNGRCRLADQVFFDGEPQLQETSLSKVGEGEFYAGGGKLYLGSDPSGRAVEVSTRSRWLWGATGAANVTVKGFTMRHAAVRAQDGGLYDGNNDGWLVEDNTFAEAHGAGVRIEGAGSTWRNNRLLRNGFAGFSGTKANGAKLIGNEIAHNNTEDFKPGWEGGGGKMTQSADLLFQGNESHHNDGNGLWCDIACDRAQFIGNRLHHNARSGISYEVSNTCLIAGNLSYENGWHADGLARPVNTGGWAWGNGIQVHNSSGCEVRDNVVAWNGDGIAVLQHERTDYPAYNEMSDNFVHDNLIAVKRTDASSMTLAWVSSVAGRTLFSPSHNNRGSNNKVLGLADASGTMPVFEWNGPTLSLARFAATAGGAGTLAISGAELAAALSKAGVPAKPER